MALIDQELYVYLEWKNFQADPDFKDKLGWLNYLSLVPALLHYRVRPKISGQVWLSYAIYIGFLLYLPYLFGIAVEVGSFK